MAQEVSPTLKIAKKSPTPAPHKKNSSKLDRLTDEVREMKRDIRSIKKTQQLLVNHISTLVSRFDDWLDKEYAEEKEGKEDEEEKEDEEDEEEKEGKEDEEDNEDEEDEEGDDGQGDEEDDKEDDEEDEGEDGQGEMEDDKEDEEEDEEEDDYAVVERRTKKKDDYKVVERRRKKNFDHNVEESGHKENEEEEEKVVEDNEEVVEDNEEVDALVEKLRQRGEKRKEEVLKKRKESEEQENKKKRKSKKFEGVEIIDGGDEGVQYKRRRLRKRPAQLDEFTNPSGKQFVQNDPIKVDPLAKYDDEQVEFVRKWSRNWRTLPIQEQYRDIVTSLADCSLFRRLGRLKCWLSDEEINGCCSLLRMRVAAYPRTYARQKFSIADCQLAPLLNIGYAKFKEDPAAYTNGDFLEHYYYGDVNRRMSAWNEVNNIYIPLNLERQHWVLCVLRLQEWRIDVYDCDQSIYNDQMLSTLMRPMCEMLPYLIYKAMTKIERERIPKFNLDALRINRIPHPTVPQAKWSGDCGVFLIAYLEYLTASLDISPVTSDVMSFLRRKWVIRLFFQTLKP